MAEFEYLQAEQIRDAFARHGVRHLFIGKSGAVLLGFADTTQDADVYLDRTVVNGERAVAALVDFGFALDDELRAQIRRCNDIIQLKDGPFDRDLIFAPDGIERFESACSRHVEVDGFHVCHFNDIIASKESADRPRDRESLPRIKAFRTWWLHNR